MTKLEAVPGQIVPENIVIGWADSAALLARFLRGSTVSVEMLKAARTYTRATLVLLEALEELSDEMEQEHRKPALKVVTP
jgi:hypothetical protein